MSEAGPVASLPLASMEFTPDGVPASALHCTLDGGTFTCGSCRSHKDCPPGQGCVPNRQTRRFECMASECEEDVHCFPGFVCRAINSGGTTGPRIHRCVPEGLRREGEPCDASPLSPQGTCREGLRCVLGTCGLPCRTDDPTSCPSDHVCQEGRDGSACLPDCRRRECPQGQRCKQLDGSSYRCLRVDHGNCPETPCPEGHQCNVQLHRGRGVFWCARSCDPLLAHGCPEGEVCGTFNGRSTCLRRCEPLDTDSCGENWECASTSKDLGLWGCMPAFAP